MCTARRLAPRRAQAGVTLVEVVIFIVIVSVAVIGILGVLSWTGNNSADPQLRKQALVIAEGMLDEIEAARFTFCALNDPAAATATSPADCTTGPAAARHAALTTRSVIMPGGSPTAHREAETCQGTQG